jgi:hypothetical protein
MYLCVCVCVCVCEYICTATPSNTIQVYCANAGDSKAMIVVADGRGRPKVTANIFFLNIINAAVSRLVAQASRAHAPE